MKIRKTIGRNPLKDVVRKAPCFWDAPKLKLVSLRPNSKELDLISDITKMQDKITEEKLYKYFGLTEKALGEVKRKIIKGKEREALEIIEMTENYLSDAHHFRKQGEWVDAFAALNYAHGWIDSGVRLGVFDVKDNKLFTVK